MKLFAVCFFFFSSAIYAENITWQRIILKGGSLPVVVFYPSSLVHTETLNVFIEGDGSPGIALDMAQKIQKNSVYIARPCQFLRIGLQACNKEVWTSHRFSSEVIRSMARALDVVKIRFEANDIRLIGYSGGGAVASILAAQRKDVKLLITVAGNLDHHQWTEYNQIEALTGSLNPINYKEQLKNIPQIHLVGDRDHTVPGSVLSSYLRHIQDLTNVQSYIINGADHTCCWNNVMASLFNSPLIF
jgi:pimeloyl-ACP methyl ester carboxylesterase